MSPKQWLALFCFYISYLFFGASVFYHIEHELEAHRRAIDLQNRIDINGNFWERVSKSHPIAIDCCISMSIACTHCDS